MEYLCLCAFKLIGTDTLAVHFEHIADSAVCGIHRTYLLI